MNLLDQYGIKEVADVTIYSIHKKEDGSGDVYYVPTLYLDTLKVTTIEKTAENTWAQGGLGNSRLVSWDYGKTINLTLEDALCTPASLGLCWGGVLSSDWKDAQIRHQYGVNDVDSCGGVERISRMEKAFYPRNDATSAVVSNLLPRDGQEDIYKDQSGDKVYLERSSVLDGTVVRGFGYVDSHPYKWRLEIETSVKSVAVVPDRFFSIYGKTYPIKRRQTVGINQPSESFKYEIIYLRGYDKYDDEGKPTAKIIYHKQAEENMSHEYTCSEDKEALTLLDNFNDYPYLKIRVCYDGSVKVYLGSKNVDWDLTRDIEDNHANADKAWVDITNWVKVSQFQNIDLWLRFDSINALSYYLLTKYEDNIFDIAPKTIETKEEFFVQSVTYEGGRWKVPAGKYRILSWGDSEDNTEYDNIYAQRPISGPSGYGPFECHSYKEWMDKSSKRFIPEIYIKIDTTYYLPACDRITNAQEAIFAAAMIQGDYWEENNHRTDIIDKVGIITGQGKYNSQLISPIEEIIGDDQESYQLYIITSGSGQPDAINAVVNEHSYLGENGELYPAFFKNNSAFYLRCEGLIYEEDLPAFSKFYLPIVSAFGSEISGYKKLGNISMIEETARKTVADVVGKDYSLEDPAWTEDTTGCIPCCKKSNLSRSIWAYVNPRTMIPYDDDYWFHQGEPFYKKSLTLSTKAQPLKAKRIMISAGDFPGMYKIVGETLIRSRETGEDERVQISFPLCKIKSDQTLTLQADGDPTTFNLDVEVATPPNGIPMEITFYEVDKDMKEGCSGNLIEKDGSTRISAR